MIKSIIFYIFVVFISMSNIASTASNSNQLDDIVPIKEFVNFTPGHLNSDLLSLVSTYFNDSFGDDLKWFAQQTKFFKVSTSDGLTLQAYYIPAPADIPHKQVIIYSEGFTESTIKYTSFFRLLHLKGHDIFALDHRGQGFSEDTGYDNGRIMHGESFIGTLVKDFELFISNYVIEMTKDLSSKDENCVDSTEFVFLGNSMGALIGMKYASLHPNTFSKLIFVSPCFGLTLSRPITLYISALRLIFNGSSKLTKLPEDISQFKITKDPQRHIYWQILRKLIPNQLYVEGPSIAFMDELYKNTVDIDAYAKNVTSSILILLADEDEYISIDAVYKSIKYFEKSPEIKLIKYKDTYHEILHESDAVLLKVSNEIEYFLSTV